MGGAAEVQVAQQVVLGRSDLDRLIRALRQQGYTVIGPVIRDGAVVYDPIESAAELPAGWIDEHEAGRYRLSRGGTALFGYTVGVTPWKRYLLPPRIGLWNARRGERGLEFIEGTEPTPRYAFLGVRACEIAAIAVQDRVLMSGPWADPRYRERREQALFIAVPCARAGGTCFCASMGTGPAVTTGFDLALTEIADAGRHRFVVECGSDRGGALLAGLGLPPAEESDVLEARRVPARAALGMGREVETAGLAKQLCANPDHPRWDEVAARCLACGNCTQVCPTCFCTSEEDHEALDGRSAERVRRWDSCFTPEFSYIHGGSVRPSVRARYRQWLTHKFGTWHQQFGGSGCVGCGRCITWCPAGIDVTQEVGALQEGEPRKEQWRADT